MQFLNLIRNYVNLFFKSEMWLNEHYSNNVFCEDVQIFHIRSSMLHSKVSLKEGKKSVLARHFGFKNRHLTPHQNKGARMYQKFCMCEQG